MARPFRTAAVAIPMSLLGPEITESVRGLWRPRPEDSSAIRRGNRKIRNHYLRYAVDNELKIKVREEVPGVFIASAKVDTDVYAASANSPEAAQEALRADIKRELGLDVDSGC